jgi:hypothetical protein
MLELTIHMSPEQYDEEKEEFFFDETRDVTIQLEHSLVSLSKWESKHEKPFLGHDKKTDEEVLDYVRCMIVTPDYPPELFNWMKPSDVEKINNYIEAKMTATWFTEPKGTVRGRKQITAELIYYWVVSYQIPWDVEHWHLNRLFTLIKVFNEENKSDKEKKKTSAAEAAAQRQALNAQRQRDLKTSG